MAPLDFLYPILPFDARIRRVLLYEPQPGQPSPLPVPENRRIGLPLEQREIIERNFAYQTTTSPSRSWSLIKTEQYVHYKDRSMIAYLYDHPAREWVICVEAARFAVEALLAREAMRALGVSIFAMNTPFSWWMSGEIDPDIKEEVEEGVEVKPEPVAPSTNVPAPETSTTTEESKARVFKGNAAEEERPTVHDPAINLSPRRSIRVSQRKLKQKSDQQIKVKEEPMAERTEPEPCTPQRQQVATASTGSKGKKIAQIKQEDDDSSPRRSTRNAPKRKFADEPWNSASKKSKQ